MRSLSPPPPPENYRNPLTRHRAMPAVPLGSSLLMVDVPLNNCLESGINKM